MKKRSFLQPLAAATLLLCGNGFATEPQTLTLKDWTGRGFPPDLVNYTIAAPKDGGKSLRVLDADGKSLPVQLTPGEKGQATLSFVGAIPPGSNSTYTLRTDGRGPVAPAVVSATKDGEALVLANQLLAVKVPAPMEKTFDKPVAADTLPAPILAFRGPDPSTSLRAGGWKGEGKLLLKRPVKKFTVAQTASGPVFTETRYRLDYAEGGYYEATVRVTDRAPFAQVSEEYDLGVAANANFWQLDLSKGWKPDAAEHMAVAGQGYSPLVYPSLADEEKTVAAGPSVGADFPGGNGAPTRCIHHDSCWGARYVSYYGIHVAEARKADSNNYPLALVAPLHKGAWRRANSLPVYVKGGEVTVRFPMDVAPISWQNEPASDVSPFSCHEHDPSLPATYGRRIWALVLAKPTLLVDGYGNKNTLGIGYAVRQLYGSVGLDRYKDFVLAWPDSKPAYPRVFITPDGVAKYREAVKADPGFPLLDMVQKYYWFTGDAATAQQELPAVHRQLQQNITQIASALSIHHHHTLSAYGEPIGHAESVLSWPDLPEADRAQIRARLALLSYLLTDPDVTSAGDGSHHGNPNMGVARLSDRANVIALIPDHPMHKAWADYVGMFTAYKMGSFMAPEGAWCEYGASYHMHGYGKILRGVMGLLADAAPQATQISAYHRADLDYYLNLLTPFDPRYGARTIPGTANAPVGNPPHLIQAMGSVIDPAFAANLRWGWDASGRMIGTGADGITMPAMVRPGIAAKEPALSSRVYPGFGVIFRAHQGAEETALYLRSGYMWSHWSEDQGNLMLYAKGAVLVPCQPYQYNFDQKAKDFNLKNVLSFGDPKNEFPHDWADSNIIDARFGPSVDYAWSSKGFPDWYINPGYKTGFGKPRDLVEGLNQKEGAFSWDRQIAFLKGATGKSPNYFVIRDSSAGGGKLASWFNLNLLGTKDHIQFKGSQVAVDTEWPTKLELFFPGRQELRFDMLDIKLPLHLAAYNKLTGDWPAGQVISRDWLNQKTGEPLTAQEGGSAKWGWGGSGTVEQQVQLRLQNAPGQEVAWVLYPRGAGEGSPSVTPLAPGVTKVVTAEGTDYVFLSTTPLEYKGEDVEFAGQAGAVRIAKSGKATLVLSAGPGKVGYKGTVIDSSVPFEKTVATGATAEIRSAPAMTIQPPPALADAQPVAEGVTKATADGVTQYVVDAEATGKMPVPHQSTESERGTGVPPVASSVVTVTDGNVKLHARKATVEIGKDTVRFVVPEHAYAQLSVGNVGVRGVGPFDLTFTPDGITGQVDGDIRTIVTTWPEKVTRPGYAMDGVRWYAGFADEHSIYKGTQTPQFAIAMGVSAGPHEVKIGEWEWPAMPPEPARTTVNIN